jgi:hypothetical protein
MKNRSVRISVTTICGVALALAGCHSASSDWDKASNENTVAAYHNFVAAHPKDPHVSEAQALILQLQDDNGWEVAQHTGTIAAYQTYLQRYPQGSHAAAAGDAITSVGRAAAWRTVQGEATATSMQAFLQKYPTGPEADQARVKLKDLTAYRMRLATEPSEARARRKLARLESRFGDQLRGLLVAPPEASEKSFSIVSAAMTEQEAKMECEAVKRERQDCQVVPR